MNETKFSGKQQLYTQFRPAYPEAFLNELYQGAGFTMANSLADIGAGTGIFTRQLLERGSLVYAVEPNADMRRVAEADLQSFPGFISVNGTAEHTTLADQSVDHITVAQAFHWFDRQSFKQECRRILKPGGSVILVWNSRNENSALVRENDAINKAYCKTYRGFSGGMHSGLGKTDFSDFFCGKYEIKHFKNDLPFDLQGFIGRNLSASYAPQKEDTGYEAYVNSLKVLFERHSRNGILTMSNTTCCYLGTV